MRLKSISFCIITHIIGHFKQNNRLYVTFYVYLSAMMICEVIDMLSADDYIDYISKRITQLRTNKNVSARDMSLSLGQAAGYINTIENKKSMPSMLVFLYICEYFNITPKDFFDIENTLPCNLNDIISDMKQLTQEQIKNIGSLIKDIVE